MSRFFSSLFAAGLLWTAAEAAAVLPRLTVTNLGPATGAPYSVLGDINDAGQAIGFAVAADPSTDFVPFLYAAATGMQDFRTLAGASADTRISLSDINNRGQVVGQWNDRPFVWSSSVGVQFLGSSGHASRINEVGQIALISDGVSALYTPGSGLAPVPLSFAAGGVGLNNHGEVAGVVRTEGDSGPVFRAARYGADGLTVLGTLPGGGNSYANGIDDAGTVVGYSEFVDPAGSYRLHAFRQLAGGGMEDLHTGSGWGSSAGGIDAQGRVLGVYFDLPVGEGPSSATHAFWWEPGAGMVDVNSLLDPADAARWHVQQLGAFNAQGQAAAYALLDGYPQAVLLNISGPVPEPAAWLLGLGALPLIAWGTRRSRPPHRSNRYPTP
jgi:uncharacterized membrane protein